MENQGQRIKKIRKSLDLTLEKFGDKLGVTSSTISRLENSNRNLTKQMLMYGEGDMFNDTSLIERLETFLANDSDGSFTALFNAILDLNDSELQALSVLIQKIRKD